MWYSIFPLDDVQIEIRNFLIWDITAMFDKDSVPRVFLHSIPILMNGDVLFDDIPLSGERINDSGYSILSDMILCTQNQLTLIDLQSIVYRYCSFVESPQADFRSIRKVIHVLTQLITPIRKFFAENRGVVSRCRRSNRS